jgi:3-methyladenine DNA glycosylase AlkD
MPPTRKGAQAVAKKKKAPSSRSRIKSTPSSGAKSKPNKKSVRRVSARVKSKSRAIAKIRSKIKTRPQLSIVGQVEAVLESLKSLADEQVLEDMSKRYGIYTTKAFGVSMANMQNVARPLGRNHELAAALWDTGWYEARILTSFVDDPELVTPAQMDRWCGDFDNWGICDTLCFHLFDRTPHAWHKVAQWSHRESEFVKRAAFALLACLALHDKQASDRWFVDGLLLIERAATDERNFVKKGVSWALRAIGRRNGTLNSAAVTLAHRLADSTSPAARWVGNDALRDLTSTVVAKRLAARV